MCLYSSYYRTLILPFLEIPRDKALSKNVKKEINALKQLEHSTIIEFYDEFVDGGVQYIVMEYCPHGSLRDYVLNHEKLPKDCGV